MPLPTSTLIRWKTEPADLKSQQNEDDRISELFALTPADSTNWFLKFCGRTLSICSLEHSDHKLQFEFWVEGGNGDQIEKSDFSSKYWILPNTLDHLTKTGLFFCCSIHDSQKEKSGDEIPNVVEVTTAHPTSPFSFSWTLPQGPVNHEKPVNQFRSEKWTPDHKTEFEYAITIKNSNGRFLNGWHDLSVSLRSTKQPADDVWHVISWMESGNGGQSKSKAQFFCFLDSATEIPLCGWFGRSDEFIRTFPPDHSLSLQVRLVRVSGCSAPVLSAVEEAECQIREVNQDHAEPAESPVPESEPQTAIEPETEYQSEVTIVTPTRRKRSAEQINTDSEDEAENDDEGNHSSTDSEFIHSAENETQEKRGKKLDDHEMTKNPLKSFSFIRAAAVLGLAVVGWVVFNVTIAKASNS